MKIFALLLFLGMSGVVTSQTVHLDTQFNQGGVGTPGVIHTVAKQPDDKILIGGSFATYNGVTVNSVARLNADGTLDSTFNVGSGPGNLFSNESFAPTINTIAVLSSGKILVGGEFSSFNGISRKGLVRLNSNGSLDTSFINLPFYSNNPDLIGMPVIYDIEIDSQNRILIGGGFKLFGPNNYLTVNIARLNANGTFDLTYSFSDLDFRSVYRMTLQNDQKMLVANFLEGLNELHRFHPDGTYDTSFSADESYTGVVNDIVVQPDGKILVPGIHRMGMTDDFTLMVRLNADGSFDESFQMIDIPFSTNLTSKIHTCKLIGDKILIAGRDHDDFSNSDADELTLLNADGTIDDSFYTGSGFGNDNAYLSGLLILEDGKIITVGSFTSYNGTPVAGIARLNGLPLSTPSFDENSLSIFYTDIINLKSVSPIRNVCIYDLTGRVVYDAPVEDVDVFAIPFSNKQPALCRVSFGDGSSEVVKVLY